MLKSFRDRSTDFPVYDRNSGHDAYLHQLGPLVTPKQGATGGLHAAEPKAVIDAAAEQVSEIDATILPIGARMTSG